MLATIVWDIYQSDERSSIRDAIERMIPENSLDWSRKGVYAYWDPESRDLLYVGLAKDLVERFSQHNRLVHHSGGNKAEQIDAWFDKHPRLGLSLLVQAAAVETLEVLYELDFTLGAQVSDISRTAEGQLIELHRMECGSVPPWNRMGGSVRGGEWARTSARPVVRLLSARDESLFVARRSLRDLARDDTNLRLEALVHAARMRALLEEHDIKDLTPDSEVSVEQISRMLMMREGKLIDDLDGKDDEIRNWVAKLADADARTAERAQMLDGTLDLADQLSPTSNASALAFIASLLMAEGDAETATQAQEVLSTGYLDLHPFREGE